MKWLSFAVLTLAIHALAFGESFDTCLRKEIQAGTFLPIASKVALIGGDDQTFEMMASTEHPSESEKSTLLAWGKTRERCFIQDEENKDPRIAPTLLEIAARGHRASLALIAQLASGQLSYGEFAQKRNAIGDDMHRQMDAEVARLEDRMHQRQSVQNTQAQQSAGDEARRTAATALFLQGMGNAFRNAAPAAPVNCVSVPIGASVSTRCN